MRQLKELIASILLVVLLVVSFSLTCETAYAPGTETMRIDPMTRRILVFNLKKDDRFRGSLSISGGVGNDINFWVTDPAGATVLNLGKVSRGREFGFQVSRSGGYTLHLDNSFSLFHAKVVTLTYDVDRAIMPESSTVALLIIGLVLAVVSIITVAVIAVVKARRPLARPPTG